MNYGSVDPTALAGIGVALFAFFVIFYVWVALALASVFTKLGEQGYKAWVPVLNGITLFRLGGVNPLWMLTFLVPVVNVAGAVQMIVAIIAINKRFGTGVGMTVLAIFFSPIWASILGFGSAVPIGGVPRSAAAAQPAFSPAAALAVPPAPARWSPAPVASAPPAAEAPVISVQSVAPATPVAQSKTWAPPITTVPGFDSSARVAPAVVPLIAEPLASPATNSVVTSANTSAHAPELQPSVEDENPDFDKTVVAPRAKKEIWTLLPEGGAPITVTKSAALLGRNPSSTAAETQLIAVPDPSKTVSRTHARLRLADGAWTIVDLNSTNGVYLLSEAGDETEVEAGVPTPIGSSFRLGDLTIQISRG